MGIHACASPSCDRQGVACCRLHVTVTFSAPLCGVASFKLHVASPLFFPWETAAFLGSYGLGCRLVAALGGRDVGDVCVCVCVWGGGGGGGTARGVAPHQKKKLVFFFKNN